MSDTRIDFTTPATLRKWPSVNKERVSASLGARPYMIIEGTRDECIRRFMLQPEAQRIICMKFTPRRNLIWLARFCRRTTWLSWRDSGIFLENEDDDGDNMTPKEPAKVLGQQLQKAALRSRTVLIEAAIRDAENDIMARISERLESEPNPLSPASAAAIVRELMHI